MLPLSTTSLLIRKPFWSIFLKTQASDIPQQQLLLLHNGIARDGASHIARRFERAGLNVTTKTFYSVGLMLEPTSGEPLESTAASTWAFEAGMTLHTYVLARGFGISETIAITETGFERLTNFSRQLFVTATGLTQILDRGLQHALEETC